MHLLRGWEQKFSQAVVEIGKSDVPENAVRVTSSDEAVTALKSEVPLDQHILDLEGPILVAAWKCTVNGEKGGCIRYIWKGQPLTLAAVLLPGNKREVHDPFTKSGWNGYLVLHRNLAFVMVGSLDTDEIRSAWPYVRLLSIAPH